MKKSFRILACIAVATLIVTSCSPQTYSSGYGYNYYSDYGDGQPGDYYGYDQQPVYSNDPNYQYQQQGVAVNQPPVGFNDFYNQLSPYGTWVNIAPYGQVWIANVVNFQPYSTNGYWAYTNYGWTWVSNYAWGWAPFHYGRWGYTSRYGWYWVPGYNWGPAWVAWSSSADMFGWAPLMPGMNYGVNLSVNLFPSSYWTFMQGRYMGSSNIGNYYVDRSRNVTIIKNTTIVNNYGTENNRRYNMGPNATDVQRYTGRSVQPLRVSNAPDNRSAGVSDNELRVYRPVTRDANTSGRTTTQPNQPTTRPSTPQQPTTQPNQPTTRPSQRTTQPNQPATRPSTPQGTTQSGQTNTRTSTPSQTRTQPVQPATQQNSARDYRPNPAQPTVTNRAAPQQTKQIQAAQQDNQRMQQRSSTETPQGRSR